VWVAIGITGILALGGLALWLYRGLVNLASFLALSRPIAADVLIVEGWIPDYAMAQASQEFWRGKYNILITTGPPLLRGTYLSNYKTHADLAAATLKVLGVPPERIVVLPCPVADRFRTYTSALAVQQYLAKHPPSLGINLFTLGCHARRSWYIYQRLFRLYQIPVGVMAMANDTFDLHRWWVSSSGARTVLGEWIAYCYVRLIRWNG
jgi:hypothetical protein